MSLKARPPPPWGRLAQSELSEKAGKGDYLRAAMEAALQLNDRA
jgi:hypothetical protein